MAGCAAPACPRDTVPGLLFCFDHQSAPAGRRGGWLSARRRAHARVGAAAGKPPEIDASMIVCRGKIGRGGLWIGAKPATDRLFESFGVIVLCAGEYQPRSDHMAFEGRLVHCPLDDAKPNRVEVGRALAASRRVAASIDDGLTVLSTCQMGLNRSALVAALSILRLTKMDAGEVIALIRRQRDARCLFNRHFVQLIQRFAVSPARR